MRVHYDDNGHETGIELDYVKPHICQDELSVTWLEGLDGYWHSSDGRLVEAFKNVAGKHQS